MYKRQQYGRLVPSFVVAGFFTGVGIWALYTVLSQLLLSSEFVAITDLTSIMQDWVHLPWTEVLLVAITLLICSSAPKRTSIYLPKPLLALLVGGVAAHWIGDTQNLHILSAKDWKYPKLELGLVGMVDLFPLAVLLGLVGGVRAPSIRCHFGASDKHTTERTLFSLGLGNLLSATLSSLPNAIGQSDIPDRFPDALPTSRAFVFCSLILIAVALNVHLVDGAIPQASIYCLILFQAWRLVNQGYIKNLHQLPITQALTFIFTVVLSSTGHLLAAAVSGLALSAFFSLRNGEQFAEQSIEISHPSGLNDYTLPILGAIVFNYGNHIVAFVLWQHTSWIKTIFCPVNCVIFNLW